MEEFQARVKAQESTPETMRDLAQRNAELTRKLAEARAELAAERAAGAGLRRLVAELSLELQQAREELDAAWTVTRPPTRPRTGCL